MGVKRVIICDCGCKSHVGDQGFKLGHVGMYTSFRGLKLSGELTFCDLNHLQRWLISALPVVEKLRETVRKAPENHGIFSESNFDTLYID